MSAASPKPDEASDWSLYGANAPEVYERHMVPAIFGPWATELLDAGIPRSGERILDLACGTGAVARRAVERVGASLRVVALDVNAGMLEVARSLAFASDVSVEWCEGSALAPPFADGSFDVVFCQQGLQFFPDRALALRASHRLLSSGGRIALSVWGDIRRSPGFAALADALARQISPDAGKWMHGPFSLHDSEELRRLMRDAGFHNVTIRAVTRMVSFPSTDEFVRQYVAATPLADRVRHASPDARRALMRDVATELTAFTTGGGLIFPMEAHIATARTHIDPTSRR